MLCGGAARISGGDDRSGCRIVAQNSIISAALTSRPIEPVSAACRLRLAQIAACPAPGWASRRALCGLGVRPEHVHSPLRCGTH